MKMLAIREGKEGEEPHTIVIHPVVSTVRIGDHDGRPALFIGGEWVMVLDNNTAAHLLDSLADGWSKTDVCVINNVIP